LEGVALIAGIFRIIDSGTTTLNVLGNAIAPLVIAKWEKVSIEPSSVARVVQET
jgi:proton glutamate symport protein